MPSGGITERAVTSGIWAALINVFDRVLRLGKLIVLANLLAPEDFGLFGIAMLAIVTLRQFSEPGINMALIQNEDKNVDRYFDTAWTVKILRGAGIAVVGFLVAPLVAELFAEPRTTDIIRVVALIPVIRGFENPAVVYFQKKLEFQGRFVYTIAGALVDVAVAVTAGILLGSVWALVFGRLAGRFSSTVVSYIVHGYRPSVGFEYDLGKELFSYGKWIFGTEILIFLFYQGDDAFVGWFLGATALGFYQLAYQFSNAPATEVTHVITSVALPAYSQVQDEVSKLRDGFYRTLQLTSVVSLPMATGIVVVAPVFVRGYMGEKWLPMVPLMQVLVVWGAMRSVVSTIGPLLKAVGRPDTETKLLSLRLSLIAIAIYPLTDMYGAVGTALALLVAGAIENPLAVYIVTDVVEGTLREFAWLVGVPLTGSVLMGLTVYGVREGVQFGTPMVETALLVAVGVVVYTTIIAWFDSKLDYGLSDLLGRITGAV